MPQPDAAQRAADTIARSPKNALEVCGGGSICEATERNYAEGIATIIRREQAKDLREVRKSYIELLTIAECDANTEENAPAIARAQKVVNDLLGGEESENETT